MSLAARCYVGWNQHWALNLLLFLGFLFQDWMMNFRASIFAACFSFLHKKAIEKVSPVFKMLFVIKNANRKTIFRVFLNTLLPAIPYATQLDLRFEKHMPCYVHRTQILNLTSAKGKLWGNLQTTSRQLKWRIRRSTSHESLSLPPAETRTKKYIYWCCHFLSNSTG